MSSMLWGAALKALGDGGQTASQSLARSDEVDRKITADAEIKRERMQLDRDIAGMRYGEGGAAGGSGAGGSRGGAKGNVFGFKTVDEAAAAGVGIKPEDIPALEAGTYGEKVTPLQGPADEMGNGPGSVSNMTPGLKALNESKLGELNALRKTLVVGGDVKDMSKSRLEDQERTLVDEFKAGDVRAGEAAALAKKGNIFSADQTGVTNNVTGVNTLTKVGEATAKERLAGASENNAQAGKASAEAKKVQAEVLAGGGPKGATVERLATQLNSVNAAIKDLSDPDKQPRSSASAEAKQAHADSLALYRRIQAKIAAEMDSRIGGEPAAKVPEAKPPAAKSPYPEGARLVGPGGKPYVVKNGVPVLVQ